MIICNKKMQTLLNEMKDRETRTKVEFELQGIKKLFLPSIKKVYDCLIISEKSVETLEKSFSTAIKISFDKTGYEASCNETYINQYIINDDVTVYDILEITNIVIDIWKSQLKAIDSSAKICFIIGCDNKNVTLRFHKVRNDESMWLGENIDEFADAVGYIIY